MARDLFDHVQYGFNYGDVSRKVLGNIDKLFYTRCFFNSQNMVGDTSTGYIFKRPHIRLIDSLALGPEFEEFDIFDFLTGSRHIIHVAYRRDTDQISLLHYDKLVDEPPGAFVFREQFELGLASTLTGLLYTATAFEGALITHPSIKPHKIIVDSNGARNFSAFFPLFGPVKDENLDKTILMNVLAETEVDGTATVHCAVDFFTSDLIGGVLALSEGRGNLSAYVLWSTGLAVTAGKRVRNNGAVYKAINAGTTGAIPPIHTTEGETQTDGVVNWLYEHLGTGYGVVTSITDLRNALVLVQRKFPSSVTTGGVNYQATYRWNEPAWCEKAGFPSAVTTYDSRLVLGASRTEPRRIWGSKPTLLANFDTGKPQDPATSDSFAYDILSTGAIKWLAGSNDLVIGSAASVMQIDITSPLAAPSEANQSGRSRHAKTSVGTSCSIVSPVLLGQTLFFTDANSHLKAGGFAATLDSYAVTDWSRLNPETIRGFTKLAQLTFTESIVGVKPDGSIVQIFPPQGVDQPDGIAVFKNEKVQFISVTSTGEPLFVLGKGSDNEYHLGYYRVDDREEGAAYGRDFGKFPYEGSFTLPPPAIPAIGQYAGALKRMDNIKMYVAYVDSGSFHCVEKDVNSRRVDYPMDTPFISSGTAEVSISSDRLDKLTIVAPEDVPLNITTALITFGVLRR